MQDQSRHTSQFLSIPLKINCIMEILRKRNILLSLFIVVSLHTTQSQRPLSGSGTYIESQLQQQPIQQKPIQQPELECGVQDKDELPDMHAAAPWTAALFSVEGDLFQNSKPQYLNTATFISRNLAITSASKILTKMHTEINTNLQLYYGNRASGKQTFIRVRKVEPLYPSKIALPLRVDSSTSSRIQIQSQSQQAKAKSSSEEVAEIYLLHLETEMDITPFSRPLCVNPEIFQYKNQYFGTGRGTNLVHLSGYATKNETQSPVVYFSGDREWQINSWDTDYLKLLMRERQVSFGFLPKHFSPGSALTIKVDHRYYLAGILLRSTETVSTVRSIEKLVGMIQSKMSSTATRPFVQQATQQQKQPAYVEQSYLQPTPQPQRPVQRPSNEYPNGGQHSTHQQSQSNPSINSQSIQTAYLETVEANENAGPINPSQNTYTQSGNVDYRNPPPSRPDNSYIGSPQQRPVQNPQTQSIYNPTPAPPARAPQIDYGSTTQRSSSSHLLSPEYATFQQQPLPQMDKYQQQQTRCALDFLDGVDTECLSRPKGASSADCVRNAPPNTKIRQSCKTHYTPSDDGDKMIEKTCDSSGNWLPRKAFDCKLDCGNVDRSVSFIVHGSKTQSEKWPWHAALFKKVNETTYSYICGATLITRSMLITAAHCVKTGATNNNSPPDFRQFKVVVGALSSDMLTNRKDPQSQEFSIKNIKVNEHYNPRTFEADIALIQLDKAVLLTDYVRPVCFPFPTDENKRVSSYQLSEGNHGVVVGFGTTENWSISSTLRMATLPVVSVKDCTNVLERLPSSSQYCAGYTNGTSVCEGDSGGAQIFKDQISKRFFIQGIISHGNRKENSASLSRCDHDKYTVFTKVGSFAEWVKEAVYDLDLDYNRRRRK
ncbi:unnamed protein product [Orchesella dallaii]|uniref:Peptidase S1 domain-containing protein n=1 Tax=Orchesella dallaii TaxID=48710 RepID=A0ABP1QX05_9HEXA